MPTMRGGLRRADSGLRRERGPARRPEMRSGRGGTFVARRTSSGGQSRGRMAAGPARLRRLRRGGARVAHTRRSLRQGTQARKGTRTKRTSGGSRRYRPAVEPHGRRAGHARSSRRADAAGEGIHSGTGRARRDGR